MNKNEINALMGRTASRPFAVAVGLTVMAVILGLAI